MIFGIMHKNRQVIPEYFFIILLMIGLKYHYSISEAEQLDWILYPTAMLVQLVEGVAYAPWPDIGYVRADHHIVIAPACAGLNFMIMAFGLGAFAGVKHFPQSRVRVAWILLMLAGAYSVTVGVNTLRILLSVFLYEHIGDRGVLTSKQLHRIIGISIYFGFLWLYYGAVTHIIFRLRNWSNFNCPALRSVDSPGALTRGRVAFCWYLLGAVGVPMICQWYRGSLLSSTAHFITVIMVCVFITAIVAVGNWMVQRFNFILHTSGAAGSGKDHETQNIDCGR